MAYKIDVRIIIKHHINTLVNDNQKKGDLRDILVFGFFPILTALFLVYKGVYISKDMVGAIISGLAIYVGLSLNLIILLFEIIQKKETSTFKKDFAKDFIANVCFSVLLSISTIVSVLLTLIDKNCVVKFALNVICLFMLLQMLLLILMLIKRLYYQLLEQIG